MVATRSGQAKRLEAGDLIDDSGEVDTEINRSKHHLHLYSLSSLDMIILYIAMSAFLACFSAFNFKASALFAGNLLAALVLRISKYSNVGTYAVTLSIVSYASLVATENAASGPTANFFWPLPFIFILTAFRFVSLIALCSLILVIHCLFLEFTGILYFGREDRTLGLIIIFWLFFVFLMTGIAIYTTYFVLGRTAWRLRRHPAESLEAIPSISKLEFTVYSQLPLGLLLERGTILSEEQHLFILLRLAQNSPYRDLLLQLMKPTNKELDNIIIAEGIANNEVILPEHVVVGSGPPKNRDSARSSSIEGRKTTIRIQRYPYAGIEIPILGCPKDYEFVDLRQYLRSSISEYFLETHPNRQLCELISSDRDFHLAKQQLEAALISFNLQKDKQTAAGILSPRIMANNVEMPLWRSTDLRQKRRLPNSYQDLLPPGTIDPTNNNNNNNRIAHHPTIDTIAVDHHHQSGLKFPSPKPMTSENQFLMTTTTTERSHVMNTVKSTRFRSLKNVDSSADDQERGLGEGRSRELKISIFSETNPSPTKRRRDDSLPIASSPDVSHIITPAKKDGFGEFTTRRSRRASTSSLMSLVNTPLDHRDLTPSLLVAILGLSDTNIRWISKDRIGFPQSSASKLLKLAILSSWFKSQAISDDEAKVANTQSSCWWWCCKTKKKERGKEKPLTAWQSLQQRLGSLWNYRLISPIKRGGYMPATTLNGSFKDLKIQRWYLAWSTYIQAFMIIKLRRTHMLLAALQFFLGLSILWFHYFLADSLNFINTTDIIFLCLSGLNCMLQFIFTFYAFFYNSSADFQRHQTCHLYKLRSLALAIVLVMNSMTDFFINPSGFLATEVTPLQKQLHVCLRSIKEANLTLAILCFPLFCFCTEPVMSFFIFLLSLFLFVFGPLFGYVTGTWPVNTNPIAKTPGTYLIFHDPLLNDLQPASSQNALTSHYFILFHMYAPCLVLQYVIAKSIQNTLRHLFVRSTLLYLLYLDALASNADNGDLSSSASLTVSSEQSRETGVAELDPESQLRTDWTEVEHDERFVSRDVAAYPGQLELSNRPILPPFKAPLPTREFSDY